MIPRTKTLKREVEDFVFDWNSFPVDYWWRKKYNVPFGSKKHREMSFIDMAIEWKEEHIMRSVFENKRNEEEEYEDKMFMLGTGKEVVKPTAKEIDEDYENLDLSQFNQ